MGHTASALNVSQSKFSSDECLIIYSVHKESKLIRLNVSSGVGHMLIKIFLLQLRCHKRCFNMVHRLLHLSFLLLHRFQSPGQ